MSQHQFGETAIWYGSLPTDETDTTGSRELVKDDDIGRNPMVKLGAGIALIGYSIAMLAAGEQLLSSAVQQLGGSEEVMRKLTR